MNKLLIIAILFAPIFSIAQQSPKEEGQFSVGVYFSPNYSYRTLRYSDNANNLAESREKLEHPSFGFNAGIAVQYLLLKKLEIEIGLQFSRQTHMFRNVPFVGSTSSISLGFSDSQLRYHYLEIPLRVNYRIVNQKFFVYISAGASLNQFLNHNSKFWLRYSNGDTEVTNTDSGISGFNQTVIGLIGGVGLGYHLSEKLNLRLEPLFRYSITPLAEAPIEQYNYSVGCQIGINMEL